MDCGEYSIREGTKYSTDLGHEIESQLFPLGIEVSLKRGLSVLGKILNLTRGQELSRTWKVMREHKHF